MDNVHYFWNGEHIICVKVPKDQTVTENIWRREVYKNDDDKALAGSIDSNRRARIVFKGEKRQFILVEKGKFPED